MKIYIYGNQSFKKEIHNTLEHSNIKFKLDDNVVIEEINNVTKLKEIIENNPKDIYLIDDAKIVKKNAFNKKIKFLTPKDGIEEEYLLQSGIADLSIDSLKELPKYIIRRYEELKSLEPKQNIIENKLEEVELNNNIELDDELSVLLSKGDDENLEPNENLNDIFDLDNDINLDDIEDLVHNQTSSENFNDDFGLNNISFDYDDNDVISDKDDEDINDIFENTNSNLLEDFDFLKDQDEDFSFIEELTSEKEDNKEDNFDIKKEKDEIFEEFDFSNENIEEIEKIDKSFQGDKMNDEFFELDSLNEKDLIEALNYKIVDNNFEKNNSQVISATRNETISVDSSNVNDLSLLLSKLLSNKTLEITIKIKD